MLLRSIGVALVLATALAARPAAKDPPCEFDGVSRIVAVGDVHGAYDHLIDILRAAAVIDGQDRWTGGTAHLVQVGDMLDRGPDSRKVLDFYRRLEPEAAAAGGQVHVLLGNHEALRLIETFTYTSPGEFAAFATPASASLREDLANRMPASVRGQVMDEPLGTIEMTRAFAADGDYGRYLRMRDAVVRINGIVFVHGGIGPKFASLSCGDINARVRRDLGPDLQKTMKDLQKSVAFNADGPLWYRGLAYEPDTFAPSVDKILAAQHARAMVVGHTPQPTSRIGSRFGRTVYFLDTGMQTQYIRTGRASALDITGDSFTAVYTDARTDVPEAAPVLVSSGPSAGGAR
jgi:hypothetical protein